MAIRSMPLVWALAALAALPTAAAESSFDLYVQEAFPKQTRTNAQIAEINAAFGTDFDDWDDTHNLSLGAKWLWRVAPRWRVGVEVDWSRGAIDGAATVDTPAGPARLEFEQRYSIFANLLAAAHFLPCPACRRGEPFVLLGVGVAYERDHTTLTLRNDFLDDALRADHDGAFPAATAGVGIDLPISRRRPLFLQLGVAYYWGRLEERVPVRGSLAPAPEAIADTDSTGPNYWVGLSWRSR